MAAGAIEECDRLLDMINTMLLIAKTEAGVDRPASVPLNLNRIVREACELFRPMSEDKRVSLSCSENEPLYVRGDTRLIQRMIANLLYNAVKYTPPAQKTVSVIVLPEAAGQVALMVRDSGIGISPTDQRQIFDRFYRCDQSRSQPGTGLGLSLA